MSRVFLAEEKALGRRVVIKVLPEDVSGQISLERFKREIAVAARLQHPHIVPLLSAGESSGTPYFTMPYVRGESLRAQLAAHGELPIGVALRILRQVASALAYAHDEGVVHRDIKPDNVLISGDAAMVTDFGVARAVSASATATGSGLTSIGVAVGTPAYMSPEQASADPAIDGRADLYAWGVMAYELLTGATPFSGRSPQSMLVAHVTEPPERIERRRPQVPARIAALIMQCLEKRPADRPQHARELVQVIDDTTTPTATVMTSAARPSRRKLAVTVAAIAAVVMAGAGVFFALSDAPAEGSSVAIMPLDVGTTDSMVAYIAEGISDGVSAELVRRGVRVAPRTSTYAIHAKESDPRKIASALGVSAIFDGRLRTLGSRLRITYELVSSDGTLLAQDTFEDTATAALAVQQRILQGIAAKLGGARRTPSEAHQVDPETYDLFMRGTHSMSGYSKDGIERGIALLRRAVARDSLYARPWQRVAEAYTGLADAYYPPREVIPKAKAALDRALALDPLLADAHATKAAICAQYEADFDCTDREVARALELDPNNAEAYLWRYLVRMMGGDYAAGGRDIMTALRLDPLNPLYSMANIWRHAAAGNPDSALAAHQRLMEFDPDFFYIEPFIGDPLRQKGLADSAVAVDSAAWVNHRQPIPDLVISLVAAGRREEARRRFVEVEQFAARSGNYLPPELIGRAALALGDTNKALDYLERGEAAQSAVKPFVLLLPDLRHLRGNPRFDAYVKRVGFERFFRERERRGVP